MSVRKWRRGCGWRHCSVAHKPQCYHHLGLTSRGILVLHCQEDGWCYTGLKMENVIQFTRLVSIVLFCDKEKKFQCLTTKVLIDNWFYNIVVLKTINIKIINSIFAHVVKCNERRIKSSWFYINLRSIFFLIKLENGENSSSL